MSPPPPLLEQGAVPPKEKKETRAGEHVQEDRQEDRQGKRKEHEMARWKLEDMPAHLRRQVEAQLRGNTDAQRTAKLQHRVEGDVGTKADSKQSTSGGSTLRRRQPNKTEAEYNRRFLKDQGTYEAISFRLPGGSRYTPDWLTVDEEGQVTLHEVKGSYRFHSQSRALTAFREAAAAFSWCSWVWARRNRDGSWKIEKLDQKRVQKTHAGER